MTTPIPEQLAEMEQEIIEAYRGILNDGQIAWTVKWWKEITQKAINQSKSHWIAEVRREVEEKRKEEVGQKIETQQGGLVQGRAFCEGYNQALEDIKKVL